MGTVRIEISGSGRAAVQETYRRIAMMFEVVDAHDTDAEPDRRHLEIQPPGDTEGWTIEELPPDGTRPAALLIHGPAGGVVVPLIEVQPLREALATAAASFAVREAQPALPCGRLSRNGGRSERLSISKSTHWLAVL